MGGIGVLMPSSTSQGLLTYLQQIPDPRREASTAHPLASLLCIAVCAVICGADSWVAIAEWGEARKPWLSSFLDLPHGIGWKGLQTAVLVERTVRRGTTDHEDDCQIRAGYAAENMTRLRQIAINLLKGERSWKVGIAIKRNLAGWDPDYLLKVLTQ